jgi:hypothetical protein
LVLMEIVSAASFLKFPVEPCLSWGGGMVFTTYAALFHFAMPVFHFPKPVFEHSCTSSFTSSYFATIPVCIVCATRCMVMWQNLFYYSSI